MTMYTMCKTKTVMFALTTFSAGFITSMIQGDFDIKDFLITSMQEFYCAIDVGGLTSAYHGTYAIGCRILSLFSLIKDGPP